MSKPYHVAFFFGAEKHWQCGRECWDEVLAERRSATHLVSTASLDNACCMIDTAMLLFTVCFLFQIFFHYGHQIEDACPHTYLIMATQLQPESDMEQGGCCAWHGQAEVAKTSFFSIYVGAQASPPPVWLHKAMSPDQSTEWLTGWKGRRWHQHCLSEKLRDFNLKWSGHIKKADSLKKGRWMVSLLWAAT